MFIRALSGIFLVLVCGSTLHAGAAEPAAVQFVSDGAVVRGRFFAAGGGAPAPTLVLVPGWPGNRDDVVGLGALLAPAGINVLMFNPRGFHDSEGTMSFPNVLEDIGAALRWVQGADARQRFRIDTTRLALGGHSFGGGMALAYAAADSSVRRVVSVAGSDHAELVREFQRNPEYARALRALLSSTRAPAGPVRFEMDADLRELAEHQDIYGLRENAAKLADRSILLIGGWEDTQVSIEAILLPLYRALKGAGAGDVTFLVYHGKHNFTAERQRVASGIRDWLVRGPVPVQPSRQPVSRKP